MSISQSKLSELRYLKRQNLEEEAKIVGNYYRDIIRSYGIDCNYYKLKIPYLEQFKTIIDENTLLLHAYGQDSNPDYHISSDMITYMEVEQDILQLNKYGVIPNMDVNFYFDSIDFASELAYKLGQLKEYKVISDSIEFEVISPEQMKISGFIISNPQNFKSEVLSGQYVAMISSYELNKEYTQVCKVISSTNAIVDFKSNEAIYKSFNYVINSKDCIDNLVFLTYKIRQEGDKYILSGYNHGASLFRDLNKIGKYLNLIHPDIGDIVTIDFPDNCSRQQFEITDCYDKNLANDGVNPLLHKYFWKCKARRYINSGEDKPEINQDNEQWEEKIDFLDNADEVIADQISKYDETANDDVYGGYERNNETHDKRDKKKMKPDWKDYKDNTEEWLDILTFGDNSMLATDGYDLFYVNNDEEPKYYKITVLKEENPPKLYASGLQYIKSSDNALYFINFDDEVCKICEDETVTKGEIELCLNSIMTLTKDLPDNNRTGDCFYKFRESETILFSINKNLYCRLGNENHNLIKLT